MHQTSVQVILNALAYRQKQRYFSLIAYVILDNHLHLIARPTNETVMRLSILQPIIRSEYKSITIARYIQP